MRPVVGITAGEIHNQAEPWTPLAHGQTHTYVDAVIQAGAVPLIIPVIDNDAVLRVLYDLLDGLFLAGGNDLNPQLYNQHPSPQTTDYSDARDRTEISLARWALTEGKPILGICRGMQLVNVIRGGTLYQHLPTDMPDGIDHNSSTKKQDLEDVEHALRIQSGSRLAAILGTDTIGANAHHHQAIHKLGTGVEAVAWAADGVIEAIELAGHPYMIGVQAHPESLAPHAEPRWRALFESFVAASKDTKAVGSRRRAHG
jgi:putative glutamine amidotransferase